MLLFIYRKQKSKRTSGFTLVEAIIYTALFGLVLSSFVSFSLLLVGVKNKSSAVEEVNANLREAQNFMANEIRRAEAIIAPAAGQASSTLMVRIDGAENKISADGGILKIETAGRQPISVTSGLIAVNDLEFTNISGALGASCVKINFKIEHNGASREIAYEQDRQTAVCLRR